MKKLLILMTDKRNHINIIKKNIDTGNLNLNICGSITNNLKTYQFLQEYILNIEEEFNVDFIEYKNIKRGTFESNLINRIDILKPDIMLLTGWKHIFSDSFLEKYNKKTIINIHPALPNSIIGLNCIEKALNKFKNEGEGKTGVMLHHVSNILDRGTVINYKVIHINEHDDLHSLTQKFRKEEVILIINALIKFV